MKFRTLLVAPLAATLALSLAACGTQTGSTGSSSAPTLSANAQAINAKSRDALADGGELRLPINDFAENWNPILRAFLLSIVVVPLAVYLVVPQLMRAHAKLRGGAGSR